MSIGILVPIVIFFGLSVVFATYISGVAMKNIEDRRQVD